MRGGVGQAGQRRCGRTKKANPSAAAAKAWEEGGTPGAGVPNPLQLGAPIAAVPLLIPSQAFAAAPAAVGVAVAPAPPLAVPNPLQLGAPVAAVAHRISAPAPRRPRAAARYPLTVASAAFTASTRAWNTASTAANSATRRNGAPHGSVGSTCHTATR